MSDPQPLSGQNIQAGSFYVQYPTPNKVDEVLTTALEANVTDYLSQIYGTPPPENTNPDKLLCQQIPVDWSLVKRLYASDLSNEQVYNYNRIFSGDSATHPVFIRDFIVRRSQYSRTANGATLTGLYLATLTAAGTGYTQATVSASLSGGTGSGGAVTPIVSNGAVVHLAITAIGTYTVAPSITINDTGTGAGATGTLAIQPAAAVLVKEEELRLGPDNYRDSLWVLVRRTYETLPGPWLPFTRWDDQWGPIQGRRRAVVNTGQTASLTATLKTTYDARDGSSYVSWEIEETYSSGAGGAGNPAFPILTSSFYGPEWKAIILRTEQLVNSVGNSASIAESGGTVTKITYQKVDEFHENKITDTWDIPDQDIEYWDFMSLPSLIFDVEPNVFCNDSAFFTVVTDISKAAGMTCLRKHKKTVTYAFNTKPDPDLSTSSFEPANIEYRGKMISFQFANALNDALAFSGTICTSSEMDACCWDEIWDFPASVPSATAFAAGDWYVRDHLVELIDDNLQVWRTTKIEYYSAPGEP